MALSKVPPTAEESAVLHELMLDQSTSTQIEQGGKAIERVDMSETVVSRYRPPSLIVGHKLTMLLSLSLFQTSADFLMHPQERNLHGQVFGGKYHLSSIIYGDRPR